MSHLTKASILLPKGIDTIRCSEPVPFPYKVEPRSAIAASLVHEARADT